MKKILFIRSDRIGEFLLSLPAIKMFRLNHPHAKIYLMANKDNIELVKDVDFIDYFIDYGAYYHGLRGGLRLTRFLKKEEIDTVIALNPKKCFNFSSWLAGVKTRLGYDRKMGFLLNKKIMDQKYLEAKHEVEYNIDLVRQLCADSSIPKIDIPVNGQDLNFLKIDLNKKYIFIHPFTSNPDKQIDVLFWLEFIKLAKANFKQDILLIGSAAEKDEAKFYQEKNRMHNIVGQLRLPQLAALMKNNCIFFLGIDSGPMHLCALCGKPTVGLFKISNPKRWGPWGENTMAVSAKTNEEFRTKIPQIIDFARKYCHE